MPVIPTSTLPISSGARFAPAASVIPGQPPELRVSADMFGQGGVEAGLVSGALEQVAKATDAMGRARAEVDFQNRKLQTEMKFAGFKESLVTRQDFQQFQPDFQKLVESTWKSYESEIQDPRVLSALQRHLVGLQVHEGPVVRKHAWDKEIQYGDASNLEQKNSYLQLYSAAGPEEKGRYIENYRTATRNAIAAGYLKPEEGVKRLSDFLHNTSLVDAQQDLRKDAAAFNPDAYPFLQGTDRIRLADSALQLIERRERQMLVLEAKAEQKAEKQLKEARETRAADMWVRYGQGKLGLEEVNTATRNRWIPLDEGKALLRAFEKEMREEKPDNDPLLVGELATKLEMGVDISGDLKDALTRDQIKPETYINMSRQQANREYKRGLSYLSDAIKPTQFESWNQDKHLRYAEAVDEYSRRVAAGEVPDDVSKELVTLYLGDTRRTLAGLRKPRFLLGEKTDRGALDTAETATYDAWQSGRIDAGSYNAEMELIRNLKSLSEQMQPPPVSKEEEKRRQERLKGNTKK